MLLERLSGIFQIIQFFIQLKLTKMKRLFLMTLMITATFFNSSFAQDSTKTLTISGSVDGYYRHNFANASDGINSNNRTSFTNSQGAFALGMASIKADATALSGKITGTVDLGFGSRAEEFSYYEKASGSSLALVKQMYLSYALSSKVKITAGKFATHVGYELLDAPLNRNYSMSYMFTNGPFSHTGVKMDVTEGNVGFMVGVANFIDQTVSTTSVKTLIAQLSGGSANGKFKTYLNYAGFFGSTDGLNPLGLKSLSQLDLVVTGIVSDKFNVGFNATVQSRNQVDKAVLVDGSWKAAALYLNIDPSSTVGLTLRSEYVSDNKMIYFGTKNIFANTLSLNIKAGTFTLIPELRFESAQSGFYTKNDGSTSKSTATALLAAVYKF
jgi:Putative beta-barrel porin-2, OmpL-like. bbp2